MLWLWIQLYPLLPLTQSKPTPVKLKPIIPNCSQLQKNLSTPTTNIHSHHRQPKRVHLIFSIARADTHLQASPGWPNKLTFAARESRKKSRGACKRSRNWTNTRASQCAPGLGKKKTLPAIRAQQEHILGLESWRVSLSSRRESYRYTRHACVCLCMRADTWGHWLIETLVRFDYLRDIRRHEASSWLECETSVGVLIEHLAFLSFRGGARAPKTAFCR